MECINCNSKKLEKKITYTNINEKLETNIDLSKKEILTCLGCNLVFCSNVSIEELDNYYIATEKQIIDKKKEEISKIENKNWAPFNSRFFSQFMYFKQYAGLEKINSILEIGPSWQGMLPTIKFFKKKIKYYFIDQINSESMIENGGIHIGTYFDPEKINLPEVDLVWMSHSLEHIHPKLFISTLKKIYASLSDGGFFFIEVPDNLKENQFYFPHTLFFYKNTLNDILKKIGFKIITSQSLDKKKMDIDVKKIQQSENVSKKKNLFFIRWIKNFIKFFLSDNFKKKLLLFYAVMGLNGPYSERPNIRIIAQK